MASAAVSPDMNLAELFPLSRDDLIVERRPIRVARIEDLPPDAHVERASWKQLPIASALTLPIETGGVVGHLIVLNTVFHAHEWPEAFVPRLQLLGEILVGALERRDLVAGLLEAEERTQLAVDSSGAGLWRLDYRKSSFWATGRLRSIFGFAPDEVLTFARLEASIHPEDRDRVRNRIEQPVSRDGVLDEEFRVLVGDGSERWVRLRGRLHVGPDGSPDHLTGISTDVTVRRQAQEALIRSESRLASGAELAGLGFYEFDFRTGDAYTEDRFGELLGVPRDLDAGMPIVEFWMQHLHPEDLERVRAQRDELHAGRLERVSIEYRYLHPDAGERWISHLACVAQREADGRAVRSFGVLRDITARKRVEEELTRLSRRLIGAHEEERALLARELHDDVTQRLAVLAIEAGRVEQGGLEQTRADAMKSIREGLVRLSEDVHALAYQLHPSVLAELGLVEALRTECERLERRGQIEISVDLEPLPAGLDKDAALCLFRVAQEALNNANRHAGPCSVNVALRAMDAGLLLAVRDEGVGFDPEGPREGRNLGLASMRERVQIVNGTLDIESAAGEGTSIIAWVPMEGAAR